MIESSIGDIKIVRVNQGFIMNFDCSGQNVILPPGIHKITDPMIFVSIISLDQFYIQIGPERWVTVPDGYDGISVDRGQLKILSGGKQHHLAHVGEKFVKMVPRILQTDRIPTDIPAYIERTHREQRNFYKDKRAGLGKQTNVFDPSLYLQTTTIEGAFVSLDVMIFWNIVDTLKAAKHAMEILGGVDDYKHIEQQKAIQDAAINIATLRQTVLRICKNHICALVSQCSISSKQAAAVDSTNNDNYDNQQVQNTFEILTNVQNKDAYLKKLINQDMVNLGCELKSICIYSISPQADIQQELDKQTKAKVDAKTLIIQKQNHQQTSLIALQMQNQIDVQRADAKATVTTQLAHAEGNVEVTLAKAEAESIVTVARARKEEAEKLQQTNIAQDLEKIRVIGEAGEKIFQGESNNYVFGTNPGEMLFSMFKQ